MPRFKLVLPAGCALSLPRAPSWEHAPAYTVQHYLECDWERPVRMLLRNHFEFQRVEFHRGSWMTRVLFAAPNGDRVEFHHAMRHAEFRIHRSGHDEVREVFIDAHRLYHGLRRHYSFETSRRVAR